MTAITVNGLELPRTRDFEIGGELVAVEATMASGKIVRDIVGWRTTLTLNWDWFPADTLTALTNMIRGGGFLQITYPDTIGETVTAKFKCSIGSQKVFAFRGGVPIWRNVQLTASAQEVTDDGGGV